MGELELNELVVAVMISEMAAIPIVDTKMPISAGLIPVITLFGFELIISYLSKKSIRFRSLVSGKPSIIIENGKIVQNEMKKNRITIDELCEGLRTQNITDISTIKYAILETNGTLSTILYPAHSPVTLSDMNVQKEICGIPTLIISDGRVLGENLNILGLNENWLHKELKKRNIESSKDVFIMSIDECMNIYFSAKEKT